MSIYIEQVKKLKMESHWDTLPPEMHKKILFWKEVAELRKRNNVKRHR